MTQRQVSIRQAYWSDLKEAADWYDGQEPGISPLLEKRPLPCCSGLRNDRSRLRCGVVLFGVRF